MIKWFGPFLHSSQIDKWFYFYCMVFNTAYAKILVRLIFRRSIGNKCWSQCPWRWKIIWDMWTMAKVSTKSIVIKSPIHNTISIGFENSNSTYWEKSFTNFLKISRDRQSQILKFPKRLFGTQIPYYTFTRNKCQFDDQTLL